MPDSKERYCVDQGLDPAQTGVQAPPAAAAAAPPPTDKPVDKPVDKPDATFAAKSVPNGSSKDPVDSKKKDNKEGHKEGTKEGHKEPKEKIKRAKFLTLYRFSTWRERVMLLVGPLGGLVMAASDRYLS